MLILLARDASQADFGAAAQSADAGLASIRAAALSGSGKTIAVLQAGIDQTGKPHSAEALRTRATPPRRSVMFLVFQAGEDFLSRARQSGRES